MVVVAHETDNGYAQAALGLDGALRVSPRARRRFTQGEARFLPTEHGEELYIGNDDYKEPVMQEWETPLMRRTAELLAQGGGDLLVVGGGLGIEMTATLGTFARPNLVRSYTLIEANPQVIEQRLQPKLAEIQGVWRENGIWRGLREPKVEIIQGLWEDIIPGLIAKGKKFDGILFDAYPYTKKDHHKDQFPFLPFAAQLARDGGRVVFFTDATVLSLQHQRYIQSFPEFAGVELDFVHVDPPIGETHVRQGRVFIPRIRVATPSTKFLPTVSSEPITVFQP